MSAALLWNNLLAYSAQVLVLVAAGGLLPFLLRVRHPRTQLVYFQALLVASLLLPMLQPWHRPLLVMTQPAATVAVPATPDSTPAPAGTRIPFEKAALGVLAAGAVARFLWLLVGFLRLRRYRVDAAPLQPLPEAVSDARVRTGVEAEVGLSDAVGGPVTFGFRRPIILLPPAVLEQPAEAQFGIACHEFLHVRRRDWLFTVCEEFAGALLWFHPAVWWLLGQIRLAREQVVDREVVSITESREPYVQALLALGGGRPQLDLAPATLFLRKRHLSNRIHSLLKEVTVSKRRLVSSYVSIVAMLALTAWFVVASFPLQGSPQVETLQGAVADAPGVSVETGGRMLHRTSVRYPAEAITKGVQGIVVIEAALDSAGIVSDVRVLSGPAELRRSALEAVFQWHYVKDASTPPRIQVSIDFRLPPPHEVPAPAPSPAAASKPVTKGVVGSIDVSSLPEPLQAMMRSRLASFEGQPFSMEMLRKLFQAVGEVDPHATLMPASSRPAAEGSATPFRVILRGGGPSSASLSAGSPVPIPQSAGSPAPAPGVQRVSIGGDVQSTKLVQTQRPAYPREARQQRIQGPVSFNALIGVDGKIQNLTLISGHPLLASAAQEAVSQWVYQPTLLNGKPVEVVTQIDVNFTLAP